ncbi:MAG TPA: NAD(P)-binding domain-containing protein [Pseudorhodoferax sp.]|nr:NAD(P)-binding domain-containing protein [Pseudorhodoferax sp.]
MAREAAEQAPEVGCVLAIVGVGQLGAALGAGLRRRGVCVLAYNAPQDAQAPARAQAAGLQWVDHPEALASANVVLSTVNAQAAEAAAQACAGHLAADALYVDLNSMGPREKAAVAERVLGQGRRFVDGAVLGAAADGLEVPILLSGPQAAEACGLLNALGMRTRVAGPAVGQAAAIKIVRSVLAKGLETLYVEALVAARRLDVDGAVLGSFCDWLDLRSARETAELLVSSHLRHAPRRVHEVAMSVAVLEQAGLRPMMAQAVHERLALTAAALAEADGAQAAATQGMDAALAWLERHLPG